MPDVSMTRFLTRIWPWSEIERLRGNAFSEVDRDEMLDLLDHVDSLVRFCSCHMPDVERYDLGSKAMWAVAHRIAGNHEMAAKLAAEVERLKGSTTP